MPADLIEFIGQPRKFDSADGTVYWMPLADAIDVSAYDQLELQVAVLAIAGSGDATIKIYTSTQRDMDGTANGWIVAGSALVNAVGWGDPDLTDKAGQLFLVPTSSSYFLQRYVRWYISLASVTGITLLIRGMARRKSF